MSKNFPQNEEGNKAKHPKMQERRAWNTADCVKSFKYEGLDGYSIVRKIGKLLMKYMVDLSGLKMLLWRG